MQISQESASVLIMFQTDLMDQMCNASLGQKVLLFYFLSVKNALVLLTYTSVINHR